MIWTVFHSFSVFLCFSLSVKHVLYVDTDMLTHVNAMFAILFATKQ